MKFPILSGILILLLMQVAAGANHQDDQNIVDLIVEKMLTGIREFITDILTKPISETLKLITKLLTAEVKLSPIKDLWYKVVYSLNLVSGFMVFYSGFGMILNHSDIARRNKSKRMLRNSIISIVLVSSSFFIYTNLLDLSNSLASYSFSYIENYFSISRF